jgi:hypothetical protein
VFLFMLAGCTITTSPRRHVVTRPTNGGGPTNVGGGGGGTVSSDPRQAIDQIERQMVGQGFARGAPVVHNNNMATGGLIAYAIDARAGGCYVPIAVAPQGADLNMVVLDPRGQTIQYNVNPDPHPWVSFCATESGRYVARLQMVSGSGGYFYALYQGTNQVSLAGLFGESTQQVQTAQIDPQTQQRLARLDAQLQAENFRRVAEPQGLQLGRGEDRNFPLTLQQGFCYAFATLGGQGASDTDVFIVDGSGNQLVDDVRTDVDALVRYCPQQSGSYTLRARMYGGEGPLFVAGYVQGAGGGASTNVISQTSTGGGNLDDNFRLLNSDMQARGYEPFGQPSNGQLQQGETRDFPLSLEGGKCYAILAVGDSGVRDLDVLLLSGGNEIDRDIETDPRPIVRVCPRSNGQFTMRVRMYSGSGSFIYAPYRWPRGTQGPFGLSGLIYVRLAEVTQLLNVEGYEPDVDATPDNGTLRSEGQTRSHNLNLSPNVCYSVLVVGGDGVHDLDVALKQGNQSVATDGTRNAFPSVRHCTTGSGRFTLEVRAASGSGNYFYQIFRRSS